MLTKVKDDREITEDEAVKVVIDPTWDEATIKFMIRRKLEEIYGVPQMMRRDEYVGKTD